MDDSLLRGCVAARIVEALTNYARADQPLTTSRRWWRLASRWRSASGLRSRDTDAIFVPDDESFWHSAANNRLPTSVHLVGAALTEWVARVPGLYWRAGSAQTRQVEPGKILFRTSRHVTYQPLGKSQMVTGGIGTLRFPPAEDGYRLVTLSPSHNASAGIPTLVSPEVWEALQLSEGDDLQVDRAICRDMPLTWASRFPIISGIRRICLVLDDSSTVKVLAKKTPVEVHPFSVMEYEDGNAQLHDFVYVTADTSERAFRGDVLRFFDDYRRDQGRDGTYLTSADIVEPMWQAMFDDPADMRRQKAPQLRLIERRVEEAATHQEVTEALIRKLCSLDAPGDLMRLSEKAEIPYRRWWIDGSTLANAAQRLVDAAIQSDRQLALLDAVHEEEFTP